MNKKKIILLTVTSILTIIIFLVSTHLQKELINYKPQIECLVLSQDILENQKVSEEMFVLKEIPLDIVSNIPIVTKYEDISELYAKDNVLKGQIAIKNQFDTKENLSIYEIENGKEKISLKISSPENGLSYAIKPNNNIAIYATLRSDYANTFLDKKETLSVGDEYDGYTVIKLLNSVEVLGIFNIDGIEVDSYEDGNIDSIMIPVTPEEAKEINLLREIATFSVTGVNVEVVEESIV